MKNLITVIIIFIGIFASYGQHTVEGTVTDDNNIPIPFANVILHFQQEKNRTPKGEITNDQGQFKFSNIQKGIYQLEISVLGFKIEKSDTFSLESKKTFNFTLKEENQTLSEVEIKIKRPVIKQTAEKLIVDLEKTEMINSNLQDVMRKVPGILVTNNGISVAGKSGVRILINGKTTEYMDVDTLLRDFPADNIAKVEVVEQPGAEYDASGTGAVINIILKKNVKLGTHGSAMFWVGEDEGFEYGTRASIASYKNKLNWQASIGHSKPTWRDDLFLIRTVGDETYDQVTREPYDPTNLNFGGSLDYYINQHHSIGIGGRWNKRQSDRIATSRTIVTDANSSNTLFSENTFDRNRVDFNINPYYEYKTDKDKLLIDFNYIDYLNDDINTLYDVAGSNIPFEDRRYIQDGKYNIKTYRIDYSRNLTDDFKLSFGSKFSDVNTDNDLQSFIENDSNGFNLDPETSSRFLIDETIFALYTKLNTSFGKWSFSGGLRYEDSNTDGTSIYLKNGQMVNEVNKRPIRKLFPSASISRKITEAIGASLSYSYRIERPSYGSLNSFQEFLDPFSASEGNPRLRPAFTNNYQFNLTYEGQPFFSVGYSKTNDVIFDLIKQNNETAQIRQQAVNVENFENWNFRLFGPLDFIENLDGFTGFIVNRNSFNSATHEVNLSKWNLLWFIQANYKLPWEINLEVSGNYGTGALEGQIEVDWLAGLDFSLGKKFLDNKLKVNLGFNKMLNRGFVGNIDYGNGTANVESNGSRQNIQLRVSYSFGSKFGKKKSKRNSSRDEENRIENNN
ncbi:Outer membrane receptor proteins, mostly Fe transport [Tenacibaculum sp. MAR_2009_124]|uniref:outer membrane beta-barrel protein n=1 Tax=Tenacibaculum sp. MAR_2009_124 TaxID=1250059 RepID=UPI00089D2304|nr:outer membrane beta-barrel protein [Tenacibaculum sp. MAR_2009_124]SED19863.1 Outer membrane receptor proteins, mostly Fe transport [Tenacibaculum sp. MAR_2009_124]